MDDAQRAHIATDVDHYLRQAALASQPSLAALETWWMQCAQDVCSAISEVVNDPGPLGAAALAGVSYGYANRVAIPYWFPLEAIYAEEDDEDSGELKLHARLELLVLEAHHLPKSILSRVRPWFGWGEVTVHGALDPHRSGGFRERSALRLFGGLFPTAGFDGDQRAQRLVAQRVVSDLAVESERSALSFFHDDLGWVGRPDTR